MQDVHSRRSQERRYRWARGQGCARSCENRRNITVAIQQVVVHYSGLLDELLQKHFAEAARMRDRQTDIFIEMEDFNQMPIDLRSTGESFQKLLLRCRRGSDKTSGAAVRIACRITLAACSAAALPSETLSLKILMFIARPSPIVIRIVRHCSDIQCSEKRQLNSIATWLLSGRVVQSWTLPAVCSDPFRQAGWSARQDHPDRGSHLSAPNASGTGPCRT